MTPSKRSRSMTLPTAPPITSPRAMAIRTLRTRLSQNSSTTMIAAPATAKTSEPRSERLNRPKLIAGIAGQHQIEKPRHREMMRRAAGLAEKMQHPGFAELIEHRDDGRHGESMGNHRAGDHHPATAASDTEPRSTTSAQRRHRSSCPGRVRLPAAPASSARSASPSARLHDDADPRRIGQRERPLRRASGAHRSRRGDAQLGEIDLAQQRQQPVRDAHVDRGLQARPDALGGALDFERAGDDPPQIAQFGPARRRAPGRATPAAPRETVRDGCCDPARRRAARARLPRR